MTRLVCTVLTALTLGVAATANAADADWTKVGTALGRTGNVQPGGVYKVGFPRTDLRVKVDGVSIKPTLALGSWVAFAPMGDQAAVMGDLVLTGEEVPLVMSRLLKGGIDATALHNHLLRSVPGVCYMHIGGRGDPVELAATLHAALALSKTPIAAPAATPVATAIDLDTAALDTALGHHGKANGGVYQFSIPRADVTREDGMEVPPSMGMAIVINFQPTGKGKAAIAGDFVLLPQEVSPVLHAFNENGIEITALHSHMVGDDPHMFFMHFWANSDAQKLAKGLRTVLDKVNAKKE